MKVFYLPSNNYELPNNHKALNHSGFLLRTLETVATDLLQLHTELIPAHKAYSDLDLSITKHNKSAQPEEIKALKTKISRLHNRGSLTDEEVHSMLDKITLNSYSPAINIITSAHKSKLGNSTHDETSVTESREKQRMRRSFTKDSVKKKKSLHSTFKHLRPVTRNVSLPKAVLTEKFKDKPKAIKLKSKSPYSYISPTNK